MSQQGNFKYALENLRTIRWINPNAIVRLARNHRYDGKRGWWWRVEFSKYCPTQKVRIITRTWAEMMSAAGEDAKS